MGGVPWRERWKARIFASILCGSCPPMLDCALLMFGSVVGAFGLRAFWTRPRGVDEGVMDAGSDVDRRVGIREVLEESKEGLPNGDLSSSSVDSGDRGLVAKSFESSGALGGLSGEEAIAAYPDSYLDGIDGPAIVQSLSVDCTSRNHRDTCSSRLLDGDLLARYNLKD